MSIDTTITYRDGTRPATVAGSPIPLKQDSQGNIEHDAHPVFEIASKISDQDTRVTFDITPTAAHAVFVADVQALALQHPTPPDAGGVTWAVTGTGVAITLTAPGIANVGRKYVFDSPTQPSVKLKVTVERT